MKVACMYGEKNLYDKWVCHVMTTNILCNQLGIPIFNIQLEWVYPQALEILKSNGILSHCDKKTPDNTWLFDSNASDKLHHSGLCHSQWAERIMRIINENTSQ
jgi:hypothetical protein